MGKESMEGLVLTRILHHRCRHMSQTCLNTGSNLLQVVVQFNGRYIIVIGFMSVVSKPSFPTIPDYVPPIAAQSDPGLMCEILWSGPQPNPVRGPSKRGVGLPFGGDVTKRLLKDNNLGNTVIRKKTIVKKKSMPELTPAATASNTSVPPKSQLICQKCNYAIKDAKTELKKDSRSPLLSSSTENWMNRKVNDLVNYAKTISVLHSKNSKYGDKGEFTQSSNRSICEYSASTSISEERNLSGCIVINRPHMSKDMRWQAINHTMKQNGFLGLRHVILLKKLGCGDIGTVYLAELVGTNYPFAIKVMDNAFLERRQKMLRAHMEWEILSILDHPFLPTLYAHFVLENLSCWVMDYYPGGDLHVLRQKQPARYFHEQVARFLRIHWLY
ncbi:putative protein kinase AGC-RSK-2 family [Helianthus debilis subsp. tardiflorus]